MVRKVNKINKYKYDIIHLYKGEKYERRIANFK
jgi:hypothetical protein